MFFKDIPGQEEVKNYFIRCVNTQRVPHALLITGPRGSGKLPLAIAFSTFLQCRDRQKDDACGHCPACRKSLQYIHPDIHYAFPVIKFDDKLKRDETFSQHFMAPWRTYLKDSPFRGYDRWLHTINAQDKPANINVKECNEIIRHLGLKTYEGQYKIQIIWKSELIGKESNRLLKLIEEPAPETVIILIADQQDQILNTIQSRCQIIAVPPFTDDDLHNFLDKTFPHHRNMADEIVHLADGNIENIYSYVEGGEEGYSEKILDWLRLAYGMQPEKLDAWVRATSAWGKHDVKMFFSYALHFCKEYLQSLHRQTTDGVKLTLKEKDTVLRLQDLLDAQQAEEITALAQHVISMIDRNLNMKVLLMSTSLRVGALLRQRHKVLS